MITRNSVAGQTRCLEDLTVGDRFITPGTTVSEAEIIDFARRFDPQPMHTDPEAAIAGPLHGLAASGWHTAAIVMRLIIEAHPLGDGPVLGLGVDELRWPTPVRPGDTITAEIEIVAITASRSKPTHGIVKIHVTARNQNGETVYSTFPNLWVPRRSAATA